MARSRESAEPASGIDLAGDVDVERHDRRPEISGELKIVLVEGPQPPRRHPLALGTEVNRAPGSPEKILGSLEPSGPVGRLRPWRRPKRSHHVADDAERRHPPEEAAEVLGANEPRVG